ncbi:MAG: sialate O-acetylesterase [Clostridiales bacterium]|nr:sialate O-acetylesterase [Clostridiales bacterium]
MIKPNFLFSDNAVLQREKEIVVFGECDCSKITVKYSNYCVEAKIVGNRFEAKLPPMKANICDELIFESKNETVRLKNVITGDVWVAAGQSNMEHPTFCTYYDEKILQYDNKIRLFTVPRCPYKDAQVWGWHFNGVYSNDTPWEIFNKRQALGFSAVATNFVKRLRQSVDVPIGIISCNRGGTDMESWIDRQALLKNQITRYMVDEYDKKFSNVDIEEYKTKYQEYQNELAKFINDNEHEFNIAKNIGVDRYLKEHVFRKPIPEGPFDTQVPGNCWDNMVIRIASYSISGVLWYQGESNTRITPYGHKVYFNTLMETLVREWRKAFNDKELPFYTVQLAAYDSLGSEKKNWSEIRAAQEEFAKNKNIYMITAIDIGEKKNIHPANKAPVGERLALAVLANHYRVNVKWKSPSINKLIKKGKEGVLQFKNVKEFRCVSNNPQSFYITNKMGEEKSIEVKICRKTIRFNVEEGYVRIGYCNRNYALPDVYNEDGLPLLPFEIEI